MHLSAFLLDYRTSIVSKQYNMNRIGIVSDFAH